MSHPRVQPSLAAANGGRSRPTARSWAVLAIVLAMLTVTGIWAFLPLPEPAMPAVETIRPEPASARTPATLAGLDTAPFRAPLWIAPPPPPPPAPAAAPPPPPPPMRLQLLAIVQDEKGGGLRAVIYDPDADQILVAAEGEKLAGRTLRKVEAARIELLDHGSVRALSLRDDATAKGTAP